ncbi:GPI alpha-1,2-mannosyltransferase 3-like isoform X2 [Oculina patagonica]
MAVEDVTRRKQASSDEFISDQPPSSEQSEVTCESPNVSEWFLLAALLLFRIFNAFLVRTFFVPDEFWQGPEVAHRIVFGYGYLTWEWKQGLRGWTFPLIFATSYKFLALFGVDTAKLLVVVPRLVQACFAACGDLFLYKLAVKKFGFQTGKFTLICYLTSWFTFYSVTRTLTNSLETILTTIALYYWPLDSKNDNGDRDVIKALSFAAFSCIIRPTAAIIWIPLCTLYLFSSPNKSGFIFKCVLPIGCFAMLWSLAVNSWFYGKWTLVELNFVKFNVVNDMGTFYGSHPWHWYFTQGFPVVMFTHLIPFACGVYKAFPRQQTLAWLTLWTIIVYSFLGHKEFRFIFPVVPLAMCYCGLFLSSLCGAPSNKKENTFESGSVGSLKWKAKIMLLFLAITNIPLALYTSTIHQKGTVDVMEYIQVESSKLRSDDNLSVLFLMPCHSTPFYSFVHRNISMRILECPASDKPGYIDEADQFYTHPSSWLSEHFGNTSWQKEDVNLPTHIVLYNVLLPCARYFHTHFPEGRIGSEVLVYCHQKSL